MDMQTLFSAQNTKSGSATCFFETILEEIPEAIWMIDADDIVYYANKAMEQIAGVSRDSLAGKNIISECIIRPREKFLEQYTSARELKKRHRFEIPLIDANENHTIQNGWLIPLWHEGDYAGMLCTMHDGTQTANALATLSRDELLLRKAFDTLPTGAWITDTSGNLIRSNIAGNRIWGVESFSDIADIHTFKARHLPSHEEITPENWALLHAIKNGTATENELLEIDAFDGVTRIIRNYTAPLKDDKNQLLGAIVVNQDITEQQRTEEALNASKKRLIIMIDRIPEAVFLMDAFDGAILNVNAFAIKQYGYSREEFLRLNATDLDVDTGIHVQERLAELTFKKQLIFETEHKTKHGVVFPVEVHSHCYESEDHITLITICRDITARKKNEQIEKRYKEQLESEVARRTAQLQEKNQELQKLNELFTGRESRIKELRDKLKKLEAASSQPKE